MSSAPHLRSHQIDEIRLIQSLNSNSHFHHRSHLSIRVNARTLFQQVDGNSGVVDNQNIPVMNIDEFACPDGRRSLVRPILNRKFKIPTTVFPSPVSIFNPSIMSGHGCDKFWSRRMLQHGRSIAMQEEIHQSQSSGCNHEQGAESVVHFTENLQVR